MQRFLAAMILAMATLPSQAASQWCQSKVSYLLTDGSGNLMILPVFRGDWIALCNINTDRSGIPAGVCRAWSATLQVALTTAKDVIVFYGEAPACNTLPTYGAAPIPGYVAIIQ